MEKIVKHDGDGKLYYADNNGIPKWLMEVEIYEADMVENAINRLFEERALANAGTSEKDLRVCEVSGSVNWRGKLIAFMEGLEIENVDDFIVKAKLGDYRRLGEVMSKRIKELKHCR